MEIPSRERIFYVFSIANDAPSLSVAVENLGCSDGRDMQQVS